MGSGTSDVTERARAAAEELRERGGLQDVAGLMEELRTALEASRRQLLRLGFDLHDGPLQDVAGMGADLHLFRKQLAGVVDGHEHSATIVGRVDDVIARLVALDADLRRVAVDVEASEVAERDLSDAVRDVVESFPGTCRVRLELGPELDEAETTPSQRIAVVRIVQGALGNVARHSGAKEALVAVRRVNGGIEAEIVDDGRGFDVQEILHGTPAEGRIGLIAMRERVRLLGGQFHIESRPGGPTRIRVFLPAWRGRRAV